MEIIPFDDRDGYIWKNGEFVPWREAKLHVLSHGLHYGSSVFEGERVYNGKVFKLEEHGERLHRSAELVGFEIPYSAEVMNAAVNELIAKQGVVNGYVRRIAWRGSEMMAISAQHNTIHAAIACWDWPNMYKASGVKSEGIKMKTSPWRRPSPETAPCASKAAGLYMICTMSKHAVEREGYHDALMLDWRGFVAEATGANIFFLIDGKIHTPTPDCFLDGITRRTVIGLLKDRGIEVIERHIKPEEIAQATEAFLTGTAAEITPIASIDAKEFEIGQVTKQVQADYSALVNR
ncbi:MAG: branched-chain amino acid aminotransferase [Rickettsiales bacterium]|nr:branched-chain amino acid aminotransferase [Rickettsiales bacterium]|tara:strand:- start:795 stop:1670 length:876 start_codon:yes stop_codon:yes gene_type:complete